MQKHMSNTKSFISQELFEKILQDNSVTNQFDLEILQTIYSLKEHKGSATEISKILSLKDKVDLNGRVARFGKRIVKKFGITPRIRDTGKLAYWDILFDGNPEGSSFVWQIKPELKNALEKLSLNNKENAYLFAWNPKRWNWVDLEEKVELLKKGIGVSEKWSCTNYKNIKPGDRAFISIVGPKHQGIFASGQIVTQPFLSEHWDGSGKIVHRVFIDFDVLINPLKNKILTLSELKKISNKQLWTPQSSGISIKKENIDSLESIWFKFLKGSNYFIQSEGVSKEVSPSTYLEGRANQILQTIYERSPFARKECLKIYGHSCSVCGFNFEKKYGDIGKEYIHVHHLNQISNIGRVYEIDPINDLRPVCPNCHAMLHRKNPPYEIEELRNMTKVIDN